MGRVSLSGGAFLTLIFALTGPRGGDAVRLGSTYPQDGPVGSHEQFLRGLRPIATGRASPAQRLVKALRHRRVMDGIAGLFGLSAFELHYGIPLVPGEMVHSEACDFGRTVSSTQAPASPPLLLEGTQRVGSSDKAGRTGCPSLTSSCYSYSSRCWTKLWVL